MLRHRLISSVPMVVAGLLAACASGRSPGTATSAEPAAPPALDAIAADDVRPVSSRSRAAAVGIYFPGSVASPAAGTVDPDTRCARAG